MRRSIRVISLPSRRVLWTHSRWSLFFIVAVHRSRRFCSGRAFRCRIAIRGSRGRAAWWSIGRVLLAVNVNGGFGRSGACSVAALFGTSIWLISVAAAALAIRIRRHIECRGWGFETALLLKRSVQNDPEIGRNVCYTHQ